MLHVGLHRLEPRLHLARGVAVELDEQQLARLADEVVEQAAVAGVHLAVVDDHVADELDRRRAVLEERDGRLHALDEVGEVDDAEALVARQGHEVDARLGDGDERALRADDGAGEVHGAVAGEVVEVVAHDAAQDAGEALRYLVRVLPGEAARLAVDRALEVVARELVLQRLTHHGREVRPAAVREDGVDIQDVVERLAVDDGVRAAGVVADAAAHSGAGAGDGVRPVHEAVLAHRGGEVIVDDAGLHARPPRLRRDFNHVAHVLGEVHDDGVVGRLSRERRPAAAWSHGHAVLARDADRGLDVVRRARHDDADRRHLEDGGVGGVHEAVVVVHPHFTGDLAAQPVGDGVDLGGGDGRALAGGFVQQWHRVVPPARGYSTPAELRRASPNLTPARGVAWAS